MAKLYKELMSILKTPTLQNLNMYLPMNEIPEKSLKLLETASRISDTLANLESDMLGGKGIDANRVTIHNSKESAALHESRSKVEAVIPPSHTLGLKDQKFLEFHEPEIQRETTTINKYSHSGDQKQNSEIGGLMNRIAALESSLKSPESRISKQKSAKQVLEIKALLDQNDILRKEHRRMQEVQASLRLRIVESSHLQASYKLEVGDQVTQERILQRLDDLLGQVVSSESQTHESLSNTKHIHVYRDTLSSCKKIIKNVHDTSPTNILNLCQTITHVISESFNYTWEIIKESQGLDAKIDRFRDENLVVNQDATKTITMMRQEVNSLQTSKIKLEQQLAGLKEKYQQLKGQYAQVGLENIPRPEMGQNVELKMESLQKRNTELIILNDQLNFKISGCNKEDKEIENLKMEKKVLEKERLVNIKAMGVLKQRVYEERLKKSKDGRDCKVVAEIVRRKGNERDERTTDSLGRIFEQQLEMIRPQLSQPLAKEYSEQTEEKIFKVLRELDAKSKKITDMQLLIRDYVSALEKSKQENEKIKKKLISSKDKFQVKELAWLEKISKTKTDLELIKKELKAANQYLHGYHDQWLGINGLFKESPGHDSHPFDFGILFNKLYTRTSDVADKFGQLDRQLNETRLAFDNETLGTETSSTKTSLLDLASGKGKLESQVKDLELKLQAALEAKKQANEKLKMVTARVIEYVQDDLFLDN